MFNKTRRHIVFAVVGSLLVLMLVTLGTIYVSNRIALQQRSEEMLATYVERYSLDNQPREELSLRPEGDPPADLPDGNPGARPGPREGDPERNEPRFQLSTFYSVTYSPEGEVLAVDNENSALMSDESLLAAAESILQSGKTEGKTGSMTYLVDRQETYTLVAMIDGTINQDNQTLLIRQMLLIGSAAMAVLVLIAVFLARRIVRPLEENDRRQKQFVSDAGHELKTPIAVISANSELLRRETGESEWLNNIDYENERMSDLVKQLLILSRAESGEVPLTPLDFSALVSGEVLPIESLAFEKGKTIDARIEPEIRVMGDPNRLRQLVSILLDNALTHGTGELVELSLVREKHTALLTVKNDASEMTGEQLGRLFDRFYRGDEARGNAGSHYGLGLSIAKAVAESHGGRIHAAYEEGRAVFTVSLPAEKK